MTYEEWLATVPRELTDDPLWQMGVYRLAVWAGDLAWHDVFMLAKGRRTMGLSDQLYRAVGSVGANIAEGYSRHRGRIRHGFISMPWAQPANHGGWYYQARYILSKRVAIHRMQFLTHIIRLLLTIIPSERGYKLAKEESAYTTRLAALLQDFPMPNTDHATRNTQHIRRPHP